MDAQRQIVHIVRLKYFLARQLDKHEENVTTQQAQVLAAIMWMEEYAGRLLNQTELCSLLGMGDTRMTAVLTFLKRRKLIEKIDEATLRRGKLHRITTDGRAAVLRFADQVLGIPQELEEQLEKRSDYATLIQA